MPIYRSDPCIGQVTPEAGGGNDGYLLTEPPCCREGCVGSVVRCDGRPGMSRHVRLTRRSRVTDLGRHSGSDSRCGERRQGEQGECVNGRPVSHHGNQNDRAMMMPDRNPIGYESSLMKRMNRLNTILPSVLTASRWLFLDTPPTKPKVCSDR